MEVKKADNKVIYILKEKDIKEALVQYIENWENVNLSQEIEFNFIDEDLEIICFNKIQEKIKKLSRSKRKKQNKIKK